MQQFLALTSPGIEILLAQELKDLNAEQVVQKPEGVYFNSSIEQAYHICLHLRLATRVLLKLGEGAAENKDELYAAAKSIAWSDVFSVDKTFAIDFVGTSDEIRNTSVWCINGKRCHC